MTVRPRKVELVVLGRGLAAAVLAEQLAARERRVALLVEEPGWGAGTRAAWQGWHLTPVARPLAERGAAQLVAWKQAGLPGIVSPDRGLGPYWRLDLGELLPALGQRVAEAEGSFCAVGTRVRGISVIENGILGAIAEDSRYDARKLVNAAEDERFSAFARMMRHPGALALRDSTAEEEAETPIDGGPYLRDSAPPLAEALPVTGAWQIRGVAGWPLLAVGVALQLAEQLAAG